MLSSISSTPTRRSPENTGGMDNTVVALMTPNSLGPPDETRDLMRFFFLIFGGESTVSACFRFFDFGLEIMSRKENQRSREHFCTKLPLRRDGHGTSFLLSCATPETRFYPRIVVAKGYSTNSYHWRADIWQSFLRSREAGRQKCEFHSRKHDTHFSHSV